jgi:hypothetical protein
MRDWISGLGIGTQTNTENGTLIPNHLLLLRRKRGHVGVTLEGFQQVHFLICSMDKLVSGSDGNVVNLETVRQLDIQDDKCVPPPRVLVTPFHTACTIHRHVPGVDQP